MSEIYYLLKKEHAKETISCFQEIAENTPQKEIRKFAGSVVLKIRGCLKSCKGEMVRIQTDSENHVNLINLLVKVKKERICRYFWNYRILDDALTPVPPEVMENARRAWEEMDEQDRRKEERKQNQSHKESPPKGCLF